MRANATAIDAASRAVSDYETANGRYEADRAKWQADAAARRTARAEPRATGPKPADGAAPPRTICHTERLTGSLLKTYRTCQPARD